MSSVAEQYADIDAAWVDAPEQTGQPLGDHIVNLTVLRPETSQSGKRMLHWEAEIIGGPHAGKTLRRNNVLESPENVGWCKSDLRKAGVPVDNPGFSFGKFIAEKLPLLIGAKLKWQVKAQAKDPTQTNTYVLGVASEAEVQAAINGQQSAATSAAMGTPTLPDSNPWA